MACARVQAAALAAFDRAFLSQVPGFVRRLCDGADFGQEMQQLLRERLFVGAAPGR